MDIFGEQGETYDGALWLFSGMSGVWGPGGRHRSIGEAEAALRDYANVELRFERRLIEKGLTKHAAVVAQAKENVAVITRVETGDVVSLAPLPSDYGGGRG